MLASVNDPPAVLAFGDSNTWGHDANSGLRFAPSVRWPGVVQNILTRNKAIIHEQGLNGRTFTSNDPQCTWLSPNASPNYCCGRTALMPILHSIKPVHVVIIALGVNDLKSRFNLTPTDIANGCGLLIDDIRASTGIGFTGPAGLSGSTPTASNKAPQILVVAPPPITNETAFPDFSNNGIQRSIELASRLKEVCENKKVNVILAGAIEGCVCNTKDGIHLTDFAHGQLGKHVAEVLVQMLSPTTAPETTTTTTNTTSTTSTTSTTNTTSTTSTTTPPIHIRAAEQQDVPSILQIYQTYVNDPTSIISFEQVAPSLVEMEHRRTHVVAAGDPYIVAVIDNAVVGYAYSHPFRERSAYSNTTEISIYVSKLHQRQGIGKSLMVALIDLCKTKKKKSLIGILGGEHLIPFYEKFGFRTVGCLRKVGWKPNIGFIDRWIMELVF